MKKSLMCAIALTLAFVGAAWAVPFKGVEFPGGIASFADAVVSFNPVVINGQPTAYALIPEEALGAPDFPEGLDQDNVSLGDGGTIVLRFVDNSLTVSGNNSFDLWIFEVGSDSEDTFVDISKDGTSWYSLGKVTGGTLGIDIDAYGFGFNDFFSFVRLTDDPDQGSQRGQTVGADIDAVGAISNAPPVNPVPEPASMLLFASGLVAWAGLRKKFRK